MSYNDYAIEILGKERWNELVKQYNLNTKKWTYGRTKNFYKQVQEEIKQTINPKEKKINIIKKLFNKVMKRR